MTIEKRVLGDLRYYQELYDDNMVTQAILAARIVSAGRIFEEHYKKAVLFMGPDAASKMADLLGVLIDDE